MLADGEVPMPTLPAVYDIPLVTVDQGEDPPDEVVTEPSAIKYCDDVPPDLTNEVAVATPVIFVVSNIVYAIFYLI
jgi:hypothetical protein